MARRVHLKEYDSRWPEAFGAEKQRLAPVLAPYALSVEHVGSTSVPGLAAKPTVDILVGIHRLSDAPRCIERMKALGYEYGPQFEKQIPERRYFKRMAQGAPDAEDLVHVHMVEVGSAFWERHLLFRDHLRANPEAAREYEALKRDLALKHGEDRDAYTEGKSAFVRRIERAERDARAAHRPLTAPGGAAEAPPPPR